MNLASKVKWQLPSLRASRSAATVDSDSLMELSMAIGYQNLFDNHGRGRSTCLNTLQARHPMVHRKLYS